MSSFFESSLSYGKLREECFHALHPQLVRTDGLAEDFRTKSGKTIELKSERRQSIDTPNIAVEVESSPGSPGALQRAVNDNITIIVWMFADFATYAYRPEELAAFLTTFSGRIVEVNNGNYLTKVLLVPRDAVKHLEVDLNEELSDL